jgi:hypothetical protein
MNIKEIENLIEKYEAGATSRLEETAMQDFFRNGDIPDHLKIYRELFACYACDQQESLPNPEFEKQFEASISATGADPIVVPFPTRRSRITYISSLAAGVLLVIGLFFTFRNDLVKRDAMNASLASREMIFSDASQALLLVSVNLNTGLNQVQRITAFDKALHNMELLNKFYQYQPIIINPDETKPKSSKSK